MDGFFELVRAILVRCGLPDASIFCRSRTQLPGWFRAEKDWDLLVVWKGQLLAVIEFKSQVGPSFGNNFNNRTEEALGNAVDLWAAYREGAFKPSPRPWLGYLMLLEDCAKSTSPVRMSNPHFNSFREFTDASYAKRYEILITKLVRERLYESGCLLLSDKTRGLKSGRYTVPCAELGFEGFVSSLMARAITAAKMG